MSILETTRFLEGLQRFGWKLGLDNISTLLLELESPQSRVKCLHIAGTNGKGSTAAMLEAIFLASGYTTGLFTSPHLVDVTERIRLNGVTISEKDLSSGVTRILEQANRIGATYFEALTAIAFWYFAEHDVDVAILEVGLGGRFDATNVVTPLISMITEVDLDHMEYLGRSREIIAREKAGIIKSGVPCLTATRHAEVRKVIMQTVEERGASAFFLEENISIQSTQLNALFTTATFETKRHTYQDLRINLAGEHQLRNAAMAILATELIRDPKLQVTEAGIRAGLKRVTWPGRLQLVHQHPSIVLDVAHNPAGIECLLVALTRIFAFERLFFVLGLLEDKDAQAIVASLSRYKLTTLVVEPRTERAMSARKLAGFFQEGSDFMICNSLDYALDTLRVKAQEADLICIAGSHYLVGEFMEHYRDFFDKKA